MKSFFGSTLPLVDFSCQTETRMLALVPAGLLSFRVADSVVPNRAPMAMLWVAHGVHSGWGLPRVWQRTDGLVWSIATSSQCN